MKIKETLKRTTKWIFEDLKDPKFCIWAIALIGIEIILLLGNLKVTNNFDVASKFAATNTILIMIYLTILKVAAETIIHTLKDIRDIIKRVKKN